MQLLSCFSTYCSLKRAWFIPFSSSYIPPEPSDTLMSDPRPTYAHNSNVIPFCPKCQCKWKSSQKCSFEKGDGDLAAMCDPRRYQILTFAAIISTLAPAAKTSYVCSHRTPTRLSFAVVQSGAMKQTPELFVEQSDRSFFMTLKQRVWLQKCEISPEQFVGKNYCNSLIKELRRRYILKMINVV